MKNFFSYIAIILNRSYVNDAWSMTLAKTLQKIETRLKGLSVTQFQKKTFSRQSIWKTSLFSTSVIRNLIVWRLHVNLWNCLTFSSWILADCCVSSRWLSKDFIVTFGTMSNAWQLHDGYLPTTWCQPDDFLITPGRLLVRLQAATRSLKIKKLQLKLKKLGKSHLWEKQWYIMFLIVCMAYFIKRNCAKCQERWAGIFFI